MTLDDLQARRTRMIDYLKLKVDESDWHGVADAAMDLREIEAMIRDRAKRDEEDPRRSKIYGNTIFDGTVGIKVGA